MSKQEQESLSVTKGYNKPLPTATSLNLSNKPCDICGSDDTPVRFWGATSVLVCDSVQCDLEMRERWDNAMSDNRSRRNEYDD